MLTINQSHVHGENSGRAHKIFNFKDMHEDEIYNLTLNNSGKIFI